jgi:serine/threonine protein kinase
VRTGAVDCIEHTIHVAHRERAAIANGDGLDPPGRNLVGTRDAETPHVRLREVSVIIESSVLSDRFEVGHEIHVGGMARVFRGRDRITQQPVAIKIPEHNHDRFLVEVALLSALRHVAIVRHIFNGVGPKGTPYLVMEWLDGHTLQDLLAQRRLTIRESMILARCATEALASSHRLGILHRDIKPSNLFLREGKLDRVTLIDFGIGRRERPGEGLSQHASFGGGTWTYMSPEQAMGTAEMGARTDIFALGCVLFECLSGQVAYPGDRAAVMLAKVWKDPPKLLSRCADIPGDIDAVVSRAMSRDPMRRPADASALAKELAAVKTVPDRVAGGPPPRSAAVR